MIACVGEYVTDMIACVGECVTDMIAYVGKCVIDIIIRVIECVTDVIACVGLWMADLVVTQLLQESVRERERGIVNGVQNSLNMLMDVLKFTLVIILPYIETFGYLIILSFIFICFASLFFAVYSRSIRGHLLHCEKIFPCLKINNNTTHTPIYKGEITRTVTVDEPPKSVERDVV